MSDLVTPRHPQKTRIQKALAAPGIVLGWSDVLRVLQTDETRRAVIGQFRATGWTPDDFARRPAARQAMARALSFAEDRLELQRGSGAREERLAIRAIRRTLEAEGEPEK